MAIALPVSVCDVSGSNGGGAACESAEGSWRPAADRYHRTVVPLAGLAIFWTMLFAAGAGADEFVIGPERGCGAGLTNR